MQGRPDFGVVGVQSARWPSIDLSGEFAILVDEDDELVLDGVDRRTGGRVVVSMRDLGDDVSAGFWDEEVARLLLVRHPSAARVLTARIEADRYFVVTTMVPLAAVPLKRRLELGPLDGAEAVQVATATLEVAVELHALGLSAAGTRVRSTMATEAVDGTPGFLVATFGLHVDNEAEVFNDLREIALRVLGCVGGRHERGALIIPDGVFTPEIEQLFRRASGVERPVLASAREMLDELVALSGQRKRRTFESVHTTARPTAQATSMFGSDLLLAEEFLAAGHALDDTPLPALPPLRPTGPRRK